MYNGLTTSDWLGTGLAASTRSFGPATVMARLRRRHVFSGVASRRFGVRQLA